MNAYSVTGTRTFSGPGWARTGQLAAATMDAATAVDAAETYRATALAAHRPLAPSGGSVSVHVCAVAITGPPDVFSDPL